MKRIIAEIPYLVLLFLLGTTVTLESIVRNITFNWLSASTIFGFMLVATVIVVKDSKGWRYWRDIFVSALGMTTLPMLFRQDIVLNRPIPDWNLLILVGSLFGLNLLIVLSNLVYVVIKKLLNHPNPSLN